MVNNINTKNHFNKLKHAVFNRQRNPSQKASLKHTKHRSTHNHTQVMTQGGVLHHDKSV